MKEQSLFLRMAIIIIICILAGLNCNSTGPDNSVKLLFPQPKEIGSDYKQTKMKIYRDKGLYEFLNGGAEIYFDYGIVQVVSTEYQVNSDLGIEVSVYDMGDSSGAFGIYSSKRYPAADFIDIGNNGFRTSASLEFWKGQYYCKLINYETSAESDNAMLKIGKFIAERIKETGQPPAIVSLLAQNDGIKNTEKYFRTQLGLNNIHYISHDNVLMLSDSTQGAVVGYGDTNPIALDFVIQYCDSVHSKSAIESYIQFLKEQGRVDSSGNFYKSIGKNHKWTWIGSEKQYLFGLWNAEDESESLEIMTMISKNIQNKIKCKY
ncbi:hypothetical protein JW960_18385 [candidate division KSB1 bacterium]|nr:hypothetical protein [candidate division KSB1 bacterium]